MCTQLGHVYTVNRNAQCPVKIIFTTLNGKLKQRMDETMGEQYRRWKGVQMLEQPLQGLWRIETTPEPDQTNDHTRPTISKKDIIYLTADSPNMLESLCVERRSSRPRSTVRSLAASKRLSLLALPIKGSWCEYSLSESADGGYGTLDVACCAGWLLNDGYRVNSLVVLTA